MFKVGRFGADQKSSTEKDSGKKTGLVPALSLFCLFPPQTKWQQTATAGDRVIISVKLYHVSKKPTIRMERKRKIKRKAKKCDKSIDKKRMSEYNSNRSVLWEKDADVAHLVERHLAKVEVASSSLVVRSIFCSILFQIGTVL